VSIIQKINLFNKVVLLYLGSIIAIIAGLLYYFSSLPDDKLNAYSSLLSNMLLFVIIISFISMALFKKVNVWESFIEGAKEGFNVAIKIIPFLVAILVGIGVFRASGAMEYFTDGVAWVFSSLGFNTDFVDALPTAFMKPLSGSGARGMMLETMKTFGPDSFAGRLSCIFQGTSDTTFYIIALYFGSIGIKKTRYALGAGLTADLIGMITAVWVAYLFFH
ncbi:MAG TPA: spore maturation protein, partial [Bacteroidia bacterium]|nr:spore maturation protein [Bacteroidia bacterium]